MLETTCWRAMDLLPFAPPRKRANAHRHHLRSANSDTSTPDRDLQLPKAVPDPTGTGSELRDGELLEVDLTCR